VQTRPEFVERLYNNVDEILDEKFPNDKFGSKMLNYDYPPQRALLEIMASTHSIGLLDGKMVGDP